MGCESKIVSKQSKMESLQQFPVGLSGKKKILSLNIRITRRISNFFLDRSGRKQETLTQKTWPCFAVKKIGLFYNGRRKSGNF